MGCFQSRDKWEEIEEMVESAKLTLGLHTKESGKILKIFHRYSQHFHLTEIQLTEALKELGLTLNDKTAKIYKLFLEGPRNCKFLERQNLIKLYSDGKKLYSVKKLSTLGIILGKGNRPDKLKSLFFNYDIDASDQLARWELNVLLGDILEVSLEIIPDMALVLDSNNQTKIEEYKASLIAMRKNITEYFRYLILEDSFKEMNSDLFVKQVRRDDTYLLLEDRELRLFTIKQFDECKILSENLKSEEITAKGAKPKRIRKNNKRKAEKEQKEEKEDTEQNEEKEAFENEAPINE